MSAPTDPHAPNTPPATEPPAPPTPPATEPAGNEPPNDGVTRGGKIVASDSVGRARSEERKKVRARMQADLDKQARELGYLSHQDMLEKLRAAKAKGSQPAAAPQSRTQPSTPREPPAQGGNGGDRELKRLQRQNERMQEDRRRANRLRATEEKRRKKAERDADALRAEMELRVAAAQAGVQDPDYALHVLRGKLSKMPSKDIEAFDEVKFFKTELRKTHPHLYQAVERPAETTPEAVTSTPAPTTTPAAPATPEQDVRKMSKDAYHAELRKRGLTPPNLGMPS